MMATRFRTPSGLLAARVARRAAAEQGRPRNGIEGRQGVAAAQDDGHEGTKLRRRDARARREEAAGASEVAIGES